MKISLQSGPEKNKQQNKLVEGNLYKKLTFLNSGWEKRNPSTTMQGSNYNATF
jgi:hypothetical protein